MLRRNENKYLYLLIYFLILFYIYFLKITTIFFLLSFIFGIHYRFKYGGYFFIIFYILIFFHLLILSYLLNNLILNLNYHHQAEVIKSYSKSCFVKEDQEIYFVIFNDYCTDLIPHTIINFDCYYYQIEDKYDSFSYFLLTKHTINYGYANNYQIKTLPNKTFRNFIYLKLVNKENIYSQLTLLFVYKKETIYNQQIADLFEKLGISFLIIISGFHVLLIININNYLLKKLFTKEIFVTFILIIISSYYLYFFYFPITGLKAQINYFISKNNKIKKGKFNSLALTGLILLIYNPLLLLQAGLILSFLISFTYKIFDKRKNKILSFIFLNIFIFLIAFPFVINWEGCDNLFAPIICLILNPIIKYIYFIIFISIFLPFTWDIFQYIFIPLFTILFILKDLYLLIYLNYFNFYQIIIYEILIFNFIFVVKKIFAI